MKEERTEFRVQSHFEGKNEIVQKTYDELLRALRKRFSVTEKPNRNSIHLMRTTTLAGVVTRQNSLILTIKSDSVLTAARIRRSERISRNRYLIKLKLSSPSDIDQELINWLHNAYTLSA